MCAKKNCVRVQTEKTNFPLRTCTERTARALLAWQIVNLTNVRLAVWALCKHSLCVASDKIISCEAAVPAFWTQEAGTFPLPLAHFIVKNVLGRLGRRQSHFEIVNGDAYHILRAFFGVGCTVSSICLDVFTRTMQISEISQLAILLK
jgi:hypothetical protein